MIDYSNIILLKKSGIGYITLNRPSKRNAIDANTVAEFVEGINIFSQDSEVKVVVLRGNGPAFCAGYDLSAPALQKLDGIDDWRRECVSNHRMAMGIWDSPKPVIASVHGYAMAAGTDITLTCDITIAADNAIFGEPDLEFGTHPSFSVLPYVMPLKEAKYYYFTGEQFDAYEALRLNVVNKVVPFENLAQETDRVAHRIARMACPAMYMLKRTLNKSAELAGFRNYIDFSVEGFASAHELLTDAHKKFFSIIESDGMKAAINWRNRYNETGEM